MAALNKSMFAATFGSKMNPVGGTPPFDFWPYVETIPEADFEGYDCSDGEVSNVWKSDDGRFEHVPINTKEDSNVFMVIVLGLSEVKVIGHHLLNLNKEYGID